MRTPERERGSVLLVGLLFSASLAALAMGLLLMANLGSHIAGNFRNYVVNRLDAERGVMCSRSMFTLTAVQGSLVPQMYQPSARLSFFPSVFPVPLTELAYNYPFANSAPSGSYMVSGLFPSSMDPLYNTAMFASYGTQACNVAASHYLINNQNASFASGHTSNVIFELVGAIDSAQVPNNFGTNINGVLNTISNFPASYYVDKFQPYPPIFAQTVISSNNQASIGGVEVVKRIFLPTQPIYPAPLNLPLEPGNMGALSYGFAPILSGSVGNMNWFTSWESAPWFSDSGVGRHAVGPNYTHVVAMPTMATGAGSPLACLPIMGAPIPCHGTPGSYTQSMTIWPFFPLFGFTGTDLYGGLGCGYPEKSWGSMFACQINAIGQVRAMAMDSSSMCSPYWGNWVWPNPGISDNYSCLRTSNNYVFACCLRWDGAACAMPAVPACS